MKQEFEKAGKLLAFTATDEEMLAPKTDLQNLCNSVDLVNLHNFNIKHNFTDFDQRTALKAGKIKTHYKNLNLPEN